METKKIIAELRLKKGMSQDELAEKVFVTRQAVSRWETGETTPNTETLKLLSELFDVSIDTLLGSNGTHVYQCCGMPLDDESIISHDKNGELNEHYCKWCYADGTFTYGNMNDLIDVCVKHMTDQGFTEEQARKHMENLLPTLDYWKNYERLGDNGEFEQFKQKLVDEINALHVEGLPNVKRLNALVGRYVNIEYPLPNGTSAKFLNDEKTYLGNQLESEFGGDRYFGIIADMAFLLVCTYDKDGSNPELVLYKQR